MKRLIFMVAVVVLAGCNKPDANGKAEFGVSGLPSNCRAYVQYAINSYRAKEYSADQVFAGLERNCGAHGTSWAER